jgi:hypothetical protein
MTPRLKIRRKGTSLFKCGNIIAPKFISLLTHNSGNFFAEAERRLSKEAGPVRLESVQARLAQCIYLLASSRINQAWYIFGTATQMILALGLHRKRISQTSGASSALVEIECRKRVFWSAYTLDRYLCVILGRPRVFRDEDVDQYLPERINDADLGRGRAKMKSAYNRCVSDGPIFHAKSVCHLLLFCPKIAAWDEV